MTSGAPDPARPRNPDSEYADYSPAQAERLRDLDAALFCLSRLTRDLPRPEGQAWRAEPPPPPPTQDTYDAEHGVCACPGCGHVVRVRPRAGAPAIAVDADNRPHYCERTVAAALRRAGVPGQDATLIRYARLAPLDPPAPIARNGDLLFRHRQ